MSDSIESELVSGARLFEKQSRFFILYITSVSATILSISATTSVAQLFPGDQGLLMVMRFFIIGLILFSGALTVSATYWMVWKGTREWGKGKVIKVKLSLLIIALFILFLGHFFAFLYFTGLLDQYILLD